ncbi:MAG: hypothetical protein MUF71_01145 [Candidatus Kapabacteria bacterium]|jgi:hypothetical protein|nr:hypothetical protein [Candidatus Kapabacteria bacterium]
MKISLCTFVLLLVAAIAPNFSSAQTTTSTPPEYSLLGIGVYGGADFRSLTMNTNQFSGLPTCCPQNFGTVNTQNWLAGLSFDYTLTNWLLFDMRAHLFMSSAAFRQNEQVFVGVAGVGQNVVITHNMNINLLNLGLEPSLKIRLLPIPITTTYSPSVFLQLGVNAALDMGSRVEYAEQLANDAPVRFLGADGKSSTVRNQFSSRVPNINSPQLSAFAGLEAEIYLERLSPAHWILAPFARFYYPLTSLTASQELVSSLALQAGLAVRYRFISPKN